MRAARVITLFAMLIPMAFAIGRGPTVPPPQPIDTLSSLYNYTEGVKQLMIEGDSARARTYLIAAVHQDSTYAPAWFEMAANQLYSSAAEGLDFARRAFEQDTTNKWYLQFYAQAQIQNQRYDQALASYRQLRHLDPRNPDLYRIIALLLEEQKQPFSAIAQLDSAELRFGRNPMLSDMKRRLLISTHQIDKAIAEARAMCESAPYEAEYHVVLGDLYDRTGKDSLALISLRRALEIDSVDMGALMTLSDYYNRRQDYNGLLSTTRRIFRVDQIALSTKIRRFEQLTSDQNFYRQYYAQINDLASILAISYPREQTVTELYAKHLIASGQVEEALALYKLHLSDTPPVESYYKLVIDIESYLQRPDSVDRYVNLAIEKFPQKPDFILSKGHVLIQGKSYTKGIETYKRSLKYATTDSLRGSIWGFIGDAWHQKALENSTKNKKIEGKKSQKIDSAQLLLPPTTTLRGMSKSYSAYQRSLGYLPDNPIVLNNYAYFLSEEGRNLEKALEMSSRCIALTDKNPTYLDTHAWVLFRLGRTAEARKFMQQAVALDRQKNPELQLHYGDILWSLGERFMAQIYWRKALEMGYQDVEAIAQRMLMSQPKQ